MDCKKIKLLMIDDDPIWIGMICDFLNNTGDFCVTTCFNPSDAMKLTQEIDPDVLLVDLDLGEYERNGIGLIPLLKDKTKAKIIMFTVSENKEYIEQAILAGAVDYAVKGQYQETLLPVIRRALYHFSADIIAKAVRKRDILLKVSTLTKTEQTVLRSCYDGKSSKVIQDEMRYEKQSFWNCIGKIKKKLNVNSIKEAVETIKKNL